jgi:hypothetical protein
MEAQVQDYVNRCQICKKSKISTKKYSTLPEPDTNFAPWEIIQIDLFGPWTFTNLDRIPRRIQGLSIIDVASRWTELCPYVSTPSEDIALLVDQQWFCR